MTPRTPARLLAPIALVAVAVALFAVLSGGGAEPEREASPEPAATTTTRAAERSEGEERKSQAPRTYRVKPGDTPSGIAEKAGLSLDELMELNPDLDAQTLAVGDCIRLR